MPASKPLEYLPPEIQDQLLGQAPQGPSMTLRDFQRMDAAGRYDMARANPKLFQLFLKQEQAYQQQEQPAPEPMSEETFWQQLQQLNPFRQAGEAMRGR